MEDLCSFLKVVSDKGIVRSSAFTQRAIAIYREGYGWRGQFIIVVPSMDLVIVRTGNSMVDEASGLFPEINRLVGDIVLALPH